MAHINLYTLIMSKFNFGGNLMFESTFYAFMAFS